MIHNKYYGKGRCAELEHSIIEIISICNNAIHGEPPKTDYVEFVRSSTSKTLIYLNDMIEYFDNTEHVL